MDSSPKVYIEERRIFIQWSFTEEFKTNFSCWLGLHVVWTVQFLLLCMASRLSPFGSKEGLRTVDLDSDVKGVFLLYRQGQVVTYA